jgi:eukaryotic-like serine/threonine-protein kinase
MGVPLAPVQAGDVLAGKYRVERVLGVGGMGVVVAALHMDLDQRVALKFLLPAAAEKPDVVARFDREARAAAKIKSEHVARVSDVGKLENGTPYIVMEYLEGGDLEGRVEKGGALPIPLAVDYVLQACEAIAEAHAAGIVHRDLKPANLFLARQGDGSEIVKVLDFGISKALAPSADTEAMGGGLTKTSDVFGSPLYMSPEQLKSSRSVDTRADIWALGVILFELVFGRAPFERGTVAEIFGAILHEKAPVLRALMPTAPEALSQVLERCLEKDPAARYPNIAVLAQALAPFGSAEAKSSLQRIERVIRNSGVEIIAFAPAGMDLPDPERLNADVDQAATTRLLGPSPVSTRTSWGEEDGAPKARSKGRIFAILVPVLVVASAIAFLALRSQAGGPSDAPTSSAANTAPTVETAPPSPSPSPLVVPSAEVTASAAPTTTAAASAAVQSKPVAGKPPSSSTVVKKPKEDPNDFGGRK